MNGFIYNDAKVRQAAGAVAEMAGQAQPSAALRLAKNTLNGGELGPGLGGRFDQARYQTGCHVCENMIPLAQGGATARPPLRSLARALGSGARRLVPFIFSASESRLLELYEKSGGVGLRVWKNPQTKWELSLTIPWGAGALKGVSFCQSADVIYCAHRSFRPGKLMRFADGDWRYQTINWLPTIGRPQIASITHSDETDQSGVQTRVTYVATAVDGETGEESSPSAPASHTTWPLSSSFYNTITVTAVPGASEYRIYKQKGGVYGFIGRITSGLTFEDRNIGADTEDTPPNWKDPFSGAGSYPSLVFLHQQRLGFASSANRPFTFWLSQSGNFESMAASIPPDADDAIEATLATQDASAIVWAQSDRTGLAFGTESGEWLLTATEGAALTPQDLSFQPQTFFGSQPGLAVCRAGNGLLFIQRGCSAVREYGYSFSEDRYQSQDLTLLARHMLHAKTITSWAYQLVPWGVVWLTLSDGSLIGLTYLREHDVIAWHRHFSQGGYLRQVVNVPGFASQDTPCFLVDRLNPQTGQTEAWIEYLASANDGSHLTDSIYEYPFSGLISPCFGEVQTDIGLTWGVVKKISSASILVHDCHPLEARTVSQDMPPSPWKAVPQGPASPGLPQSGWWTCPIGAGYRNNPRLELRLSRPGTILGVVITLELADSPGNQGR